MKILCVSLVVLLLTLHGIEGSTFIDDTFLPEFDGQQSDESEEEWEDDNEVFQMFPTLSSEHSGRLVVNVDGFGAVGDGVADDTQAFLNAWDKACSTTKSVLLVPEGRKYLVNATRFKGPCAERLIIQISGTIMAPDEPNTWAPKNPRVWLYFTKLQGVSFQGGGTLNGSGSKWWASSCKKNKTNPCRPAPTAFTIDSSSAVRVKNLNFKDSQQIHFAIARSSKVRVSGVRIEAPSDSPNTDGIHISNSTNVVIEDSKIGTGDDCISIVNGTSNLKMKRIYCGPGHGISIGSLGKNNTTATVTKVVLNTATLQETTNGVRIKTWQGGSGYVQAVRFENVKMINVANPVIIDQFYCDSPATCQNQTSAVTISQVMYRNISGSSKTQKAMKFACSDAVPCSSIVLSNINLETENGKAETFCNSATGFTYGTLQPTADCLSNDKNSHCETANVNEQIGFWHNHRPLAVYEDNYKADRCIAK